MNTEDVTTQCVYLCACWFCTNATARLLRSRLQSVSLPCCQPATAWTRLIARDAICAIPSARIPFISRFQYIPLKTGFDRQMLAPYSSYSAFVWQACWRKNNDSSLKLDTETWKFKQIVMMLGNSFWLDEHYIWTI